MDAATLGTTIATVGYALAIWGGWKLYRHSTPDRSMGTIPRTNDIVGFQQDEQHRVRERQRRTRSGFLPITIGAAF